MAILDLLRLPVAQDMGPLLMVSIILLGGAVGGWVAGKLHVPKITGNIVAGFLLGLTLFEGLDVAHAVQPLSAFAVGLIAASVGAQLSYRRIHNALRRIVLIAVLEGLGASIVVTLAARFVLKLDWPIAALVGCIATETAPATTVALVRELRARGPFVKTLMSVVAIDNILCIMLFAFVQIVAADFYQNPAGGLGFTRAMFDTGLQLLDSLVIGFGLGAITERAVIRSGLRRFSIVFMAILLASGLSSYLGLSPPLTALFFGIYLGNRRREVQEQLDALEPIEQMLYVVFFTVAGAGLHLSSLWHAGLLCLVYFVARIAGKTTGATIGGLLSGTSRRIWGNVPLGLMPHAGLAIGLVVLLEGDQRIPSEVSELVGTLVLAAVAVSEVIGPFFTRAALSWSGEAGLDRPRLMEFLQEEYILTDMDVADKWEALDRLTAFFARTHNISDAERKRIHATVAEREESMTTAVGRGAAIPHGRVERGTAIRGVLGICRKGVDFDAPDGEPVRLLMLIVTPKEHAQRHLEVMAGLTSMIANDAVRERLSAAISPNDAWEVIESKEARGYNYFLEEDTDNLEEEPQGH